MVPLTEVSRFALVDARGRRARLLDLTADLGADELSGGKTPARLRCAFVHVVEAPEDGAGADRALSDAVGRLGRAEGERAVRPGGVVEGDAFAEDGPEAPLVEHDQVVGDDDGRPVIDSSLLEAGGNAAPLFEPVHAPLHRAELLGPRRIVVRWSPGSLGLLCPRVASLGDRVRNTALPA